jgi:hypothetical protein
MENGEVMHLDKKDVDESGFSEEKLDQDTEMQAGQWLDLTSKQRAKNKKQPSGKNQAGQGKNVQQKPPSNVPSSTTGGVKVKKEKQEQVQVQQAPADKASSTAELERYSQEVTDLIQQFIALPSHASKEAEKLTQSIFTLQGRIKTLLQSLKRSS